MPQRHNKECRFGALAIVGGEWTPFIPQLLHPKRKSARYATKRMLVEPQSQPGVFVASQNPLLPLSVIEPKFVSCPAHSMTTTLTTLQNIYKSLAKISMGTDKHVCKLKCTATRRSNLNSQDLLSQSQL